MEVKRDQLDTKEDILNVWFEILVGIFTVEE